MLRHGRTVIPILSRKKLVILRANGEKLTWKSLELRGKNSMSNYRQARKAARTEHIHKLIDKNKNNPRFLFSTVARLTNKQMSPDLNIPSQFNSNEFMNFFTEKIDNIRNTITNRDSRASSTSVVALYCHLVTSTSEISHQPAHT